MHPTPSPLTTSFRAQRFINDPRNKEEATEILRKWQKIKRKYAQLSYKMIVEDLKPIPNDGAVSTKAVEQVIKIMVERKKLDKAYPVSKFVNDTYRQKALKKLGG